jgi:hypothetical protein
MKPWVRGVFLMMNNPCTTIFSFELNEFFNKIFVQCSIFFSIVGQNIIKPTWWVHLSHEGFSNSTKSMARGTVVDYDK